MGLKQRNSSSTTAIKKSVQFSKKQRILKVPDLTSFSDAEIKQLWYTRKEIETVTHEADALVVAVEAGGCAINNDIRGLERKTEQGNTEVFLNRAAVLDAVLNEQDAQLRIIAKGAPLNDDKIAKLSQQASQSASQAAAQRAKQDYADIKDYLKQQQQPAAVSKPVIVAAAKKTVVKKPVLRTLPVKVIAPVKRETEMTLKDVFQTNTAIAPGAKKSFNDSSTVETASLSSSEDEYSHSTASSVVRPVAAKNKVVTAPPVVPRRGGPVASNPSAPRPKRTTPKRVSSSFDRTTRKPGQRNAARGRCIPSNDAPRMSAITTRTSITKKAAVLPTETTRKSWTSTAKPPVVATKPPVVRATPLKTASGKTKKSRGLSLDCACVMNIA